MCTRSKALPEDESGVLAAKTHTIPAAIPQAIIFHLWLNQENCQHPHTANQRRGYGVKTRKKAEHFGVQLAYLLILLAAWKKHF